MSGSGGYYKYRCKYWLTFNCQSWVWINNAPCAHCLVGLPNSMKPRNINAIRSTDVILNLLRLILIPVALRMLKKGLRDRIITRNGMNLTLLSSGKRLHRARGIKMRMRMEDWEGRTEGDAICQ